MMLRHLSPNFSVFDPRTPPLQEAAADNSRQIVKDNVASSIQALASRPRFVPHNSAPPGVPCPTGISLPCPHNARRGRGGLR